MPRLTRLVACAAMSGAIACASRDDARHQHPPAIPLPREAISDSITATSPIDRRPRIVILGDSLTAGLGLAVEEAYPALLQRRLDAKGLSYQVVNAGISGDTSAGGLARLDLALAGDVRVLIVALGGNDALRGLPPEALRGNLSQIIERARARDVAVILAGMEAPRNWGPAYTAAFREVYRSLARQYRVSLVPFLLEGVAGIERLNQRDGLHPTAEGDRIVADTVWTVLEPVLAQQKIRGKGTPGS